MPTFTPSRFGEPAARQERFQIGPRGLLIGAFAGAVLVALSGAFLIGLAMVGVIAAGVAGIELARRYLLRASKTATDHPAGL